MKASQEILNQTVKELSSECNILQLLHEYKYGGVKAYFIETVILAAMEKYRYNEDPCELHGHDLVPDLGFDNVVKGDICRICNQRF